MFDFLISTPLSIKSQAIKISPLPEIINSTLNSTLIIFNKIFLDYFSHKTEEKLSKTSTFFLWFTSVI